MNAYAEHTMVVLLDAPEDECCETRGWVSVDVPVEDARALLSDWCMDANGNRPARPVGEPKRVWLASDDLAKYADDQRWHPCEPGEGVEFWEFDATDTERVNAS